MAENIESMAPTKRHLLAKARSTGAESVRKIIFYDPRKSTRVYWSIAGLTPYGALLGQPVREANL
jgi:hypothetical protein